MDWFNGIILCVLASKILIACPVSITTLSYVPFCPKTLGEWQIRAELKRCSHMRQNCTSPRNFVYHCVLNNFANATLEVCAQETIIIDNRCAEFNIKAEKIVESYTKRCLGYCPFKYNSTEAYKYQMCYQGIHKENPTTQPTNDSETRLPTKQEDMCSNSNLDKVFASLLILSYILFGIVLLFIMQKYKRMNKELRGNRHDKREKGVDEDKPLLSYEGPFVIAIDIGEKYYGLAYTDLSNPQKIIPSHPMERIAVLVEKPNKILKVGKDATKEFIEMKADDLLNHVYVNELKSNELWKEVPETELQYITLFTEATLGVIERIENEIGQKMRGMEDVRVVFSASCHWREAVKDLIDDLLKKSGTLFNWQKGHEKVAFIEKVRTVSQVICEAETTSYCLNYNVENVKIKSKYYAVLNAGFGSCHFSFLHNRDEKHLDVREAEGTIRRDWEEALPEDHVWALCQEIIEEKYINQQNHVRVINQYENLHERILMCRDDETTFQFSFPIHIFKKDFKRIAETKGIEIQEKNNKIILLLKWYMMKTFFKELKKTVSSIVEKNKDEFERLEIKFVFFIGSYGIMKIIQDAAKNEWFKNITVLIPEDGEACYAVGGAIAGARGFIEFDSWRI